jgi:hypothetical protein
MGEVISKNAAAEDILSDLKTTLEKATARKGVWQSEAERILRPTVVLADEIDVELQAMTAATTRLRNALEVCDDEADALLAKSYDEIYNTLDRPGTGSDPVLDLMYPGGFTAYSGADIDEQPVLMHMLARLLERNLHPAIPPASAAAYAASIRDSATKLRDAVQALAGPTAELKMLHRMRGTTARTGQVQLARLKRSWKSMGKSEADIHGVIPDRPRVRKSRGGDGAAPADPATPATGPATPEAIPGEVPDEMELAMRML